MVRECIYQERLSFMALAFIGYFLAKDHTLAQAAPQRHNADVLEILDATLLSGGAQRTRMYLDTTSGIRFLIPWSSYRAKNHKQIEALIKERRPHATVSPGSFITGFFPTTGVQTLLPKDVFSFYFGDFAKNQGEFLLKTKDVQRESEEVVAYLPYLVLSSYEATGIKDSQAFQSFIKEIQAAKTPKWLQSLRLSDSTSRRGVFRFIVQIAQYVGYPPLDYDQAGRLLSDSEISEVRPRLQKNQAFVDFFPIASLKRRFLIQGALGRIIVVGFYYTDDKDAFLLERVAASMRVEKSRQLPKEKPRKINSPGRRVLFALVIGAFLLGLFFFVRRKLSNGLAHERLP